ncbi:DUF3392 domain-containing protein [Paraglaciecola sp. 2405UD69-4]|uniref:DUF3392 domain-containing protein n=1 Tax=Paraglaciecola sp. 2405UD69-4 TaxID=3391836 RepID=UPI0039C8DDEB
MQWLYNGLSNISAFMQPYYSEIALTLIATILVVFGDLLNKYIKRLISPYHFIIRTCVFVLICAFGYGLLIVFVTPYIKQLILLIPHTYRGLGIISAFLLLGYLAENRRYI